MPLVFVHGVAARSSEQFAAITATRDALFRRYLLSTRISNELPVQILNPYWGDLGGRLRWNGASIPTIEPESFGSGDAAIEQVCSEYFATVANCRPSTTVLTVAREQSFADSVDFIWMASAFSGLGHENELANLSVAALAYAEQNPKPEWLDDLRDDQEFVCALEQALLSSLNAVPASTGESYFAGFGQSRATWDSIRAGVDRIGAVAGSTFGRGLARFPRQVIMPRLVDFLGDVFVYLHEQSDDVGSIRERIGSKIRLAAAQASPDDPLIIVAHSMGGNIVYDLLTTELAESYVSLLVTVGTQVGLFEEMKLFRASDETLPGSNPSTRLARPANVARWINIFDLGDVLGFRIQPIIRDVEEFSYRTGSALKAHSNYFLQPSFHSRLLSRSSRSRS